MRVQRGEHPLLVGVRRAQERDEPGRRRGEGEVHLRGLHLNTLSQGGEFKGQQLAIQRPFRIGQGRVWPIGFVFI